MGKRKKPPPAWVQAVVVWFVLSGLLTAGVLYLRAEETLSDRVFQPLASVLCGGGDRLTTSYERHNQAPRRNFGDPRQVPQQQVWTLGAAECVGPSGARRPASGFLALVGLTVATGVGCLMFVAWRGRRLPGRKQAPSAGRP